ncbi:hypothetical protein MMC12_005525 [Toensbergia leucococca]|nr:hypothetical protein [Toensbergia leucococca]
MASTTRPEDLQQSVLRTHYKSIDSFIRYKSEFQSPAIEEAKAAYSRLPHGHAIFCQYADKRETLTEVLTTLEQKCQCQKRKTSTKFLEKVQRYSTWLQNTSGAVYIVVQTLPTDTSGVSVGTLTETALFSAITSGIDSVCQILKHTGGVTGSFTCTETATATIAMNIKYEDFGPFEHGEPQFNNSDNKAIAAAFAQEFTQVETISLYNAGSNFQLIEVDPASNSARELSFSLQFHLDSKRDFFCDWLTDAADFVEAAVNVETNTEVAVPGGLKVDQKLLEACQSNSS